MGLKPFGAFRKVWNWDREVVNDLASCRRYLDGDAPPDNERFQVEVTNRAIEHVLSEHPFFKVLSQIDSAERLYGKRIHVEISSENWLALQSMMDKVARMTEGDLAQFCVRHYLEVIKSLRTLPGERTVKEADEADVHLQT